MDLGDERVAGDERDSLVKEAADVAFHEAEADQGRHHLRRVDGLAIVGDAGGLLRQGDGQRRVAGRHHAEGVDEDLRADLLGDDAAVAGRRSALRRGDSVLQVQKSRVLRRNALAAPPEDALPFEHVVEPGLAEERLRGLRIAPRILEGADEGAGAGDVVVRDHERDVEPIMDVAADGAEALLDGLLVPALEGPAQIDADHLAQQRFVNLLVVVCRHGVTLA